MVVLDGAVGVGVVIRVVESWAGGPGASSLGALLLSSARAAKLFVISAIRDDVLEFVWEYERDEEPGPVWPLF